MTKLLVIGDVHCDWGAVSTLINKKRPNIILQTGDMGYWPGEKVYRNREDKLMGKPRIDLWPPTFNLQGAKLYFCPGNHSNWWVLSRRYGRTGEVPIECHPGVYYCPLGSTLTLPDSQVVLFMGGGESIDKSSRTIGIDWFPDETITQKDIYALPEKRIDIVVSHTCPTEFEMKNEFKDKDPSRAALSYILDHYRPSVWFFGHWHTSKTGYNKNCRWYAMNMARNTGWWKCINITQKKT